MKNKMNILVSGSLVYDRIMDFPGYFKDHIMPDKIHMLNVSFSISNLKESFGGTAGNIAYNLALLNQKATILTSVGKDFEPYKKWLAKHKIDLSQLRFCEQQNTASVYIITDKSDNQISAFNPGAMTCAKGEFDQKLLSSSQTLAIISPGNGEDMLHYANIYKKRMVKYIFDPGQQITNLSTKVLVNCINGAEILIGNDYEIELIKQKLGWTEQQLNGKIKTLITTKGEQGSEIISEGKQVKIAAAKTKKALDPTGAGDAFRAGLIKGIVNGMALAQAAKLASVVAAYAVESYGTQNHRFSNLEIFKRYKQNYKEEIKL